MKIEDQTKQAFSLEPFAEDWAQPEFMPEAKGQDYLSLLVDNIVGLDNNYESAGEQFAKSFNEDEIGSLKNMALGAYEGAKEFVANPVESTTSIIADLRNSVYRLSTENLDSRLKRLYNVGYEDATEDQVTQARESVLGDGLTALGLVPAASLTKSALNLADKAYDPTKVNTFGGIGSNTANPNKKPTQPRVPFFSRKPVTPVATDLPDAKFGMRSLNDLELFEPDEFTFDPETDPLGYARNIRLDELARLKLGKTNLEELTEMYGVDNTPEINSYITQRLDEASKNPEFVAYTESLSKNPNFNPWSEFEESLGIEQPKNVTVFQSPIPEVLKGMSWPKKGKEGSALLSELRNNPTIRKSELDTVLPEIEPTKRYSLEEAQGIIEGNLWDTRVKLLSNEEAGFTAYQRQTELRDHEKAYFELLINSNRENQPNFKANSQHFEDSTLAHSRASIRENESGSNYILVEELQSDLLQQGYKPPAPSKFFVSPEEAVKKTAAAREEVGLNDRASELLLQIKGESRRYDMFYDSPAIDQFIEEVGPENLLAKPGATVADVKARLEAEDSTGGSDFQSLASLYANFKVGKPGSIDPVNNEAWDIRDNIIEFYFNVIEKQINLKDTAATSAPPIKKIEESVKMTLGALISEASKEGIDTIVIPPFERIIDKRFPKDKLPSAYEKALDPKSGFYKTYVTSLNKALKDIQEEFGNENFSWRPKDLNYADPDYLPSTGTEIYFGNLLNSEYDLSKLRFAEGGLVNSFARGGMTEDEQMNKLMQEGGMADDGMNREPVTGNEVPPGSLASEVRDDIDVKLSSGEYVVPADVLRYYGVRFFEDLRTQAKEGMMQMESEGRIGGTPVDAQGVPVEAPEEELTPEEEQMLQEALGATSGTGMAMGGMAQQQQQQPMANPYQDQATLYQTGMVEGGFVSAPDPAFGATTFDRSQFTSDTGVAPMETRQYINPTTKEVRSFSFMNGNPLSPIPNGFVPWTQELQDAANAPPPVTPAGSTKSDRKSGSQRDDEQRAIDLSLGRTADTEGQQGTRKNADEWARENYEAFNADPYKFGMDALKAIEGPGKVGKIPFLGKIAGLGSDINALEKITDARASLMKLDPNTEKAKELSAAIDKAVENIGSNVVELAASVFFQGNNKFNSMEALAGSPPTSATTGPATAPAAAAPSRQRTGGGTSSSGSAPPPPPAGRSTPPPARPAPPRPTGGSGKAKDDVATPTPKPKPAPVTKTVQTPAGPKKVEVKATVPTIGKGRAKGGLITKPQK